MGGQDHAGLEDAFFKNRNLNKNRLFSKTCSGKNGLQTLKKIGFGKGATDPTPKKNINVGNRDDKTWQKIDPHKKPDM